VRLAPPATAFASALVALVIVVTGAASRAQAQDAPAPPPPVPEGTVIPATVAPTGIVGDAIVPPAGYELLAAEPPPPPVGYGAYSLAPAPGVAVPPPPPVASGDRTLRILAESGAWLLATVATVGVSALVANATDVASDPSPLLLSFFTGYFVLMPVAAWLGGNAVDGKGALGWTIFGHAIFGLIGAVAAYEISHDGAVAAARNALSANLRTARPPGLTFTFSF
jgi:hypothetical protein